MHTRSEDEHGPLAPEQLAAIDAYWRRRRRAPERGARPCLRGLGFLGVALDARANQAASGGDLEIGEPSTAVRVLALKAREDLEIARQTRAVARHEEIRTDSSGDGAASRGL
jgi:hypothetical protein